MTQWDPMSYQDLLKEPKKEGLNAFLLGTGIYKTVTVRGYPCKMYLNGIRVEGGHLNPPYYIRVEKYILAPLKEKEFFIKTGMVILKTFKDKTLVHETMTIGYGSLGIFNRFLFDMVRNYEYKKLRK